MSTSNKENRVRQLVSIKLLVDVDKERLKVLDPAVSQVMGMARKGRGAFYIKVLGMDFTIMQPTKLESIHLGTKAIHYGDVDFGACSSKLIPASRLTEKWEQVTCKQCLRKRPKTVQQELFT